MRNISSVPRHCCVSWHPSSSTVSDYPPLLVLRWKYVLKSHSYLWQLLTSDAVRQTRPCDLSITTHLATALDSDRGVPVKGVSLLIVLFIFCVFIVEHSWDVSLLVNMTHSCSSFILSPSDLLRMCPSCRHVDIISCGAAQNIFSQFINWDSFLTLKW